MPSQPKAIIYTRVSTENQEREGTSLSTQLKRCQAYASEQNYAIVGEYADTYSGAKYREREGLSALREQVRAGGVDVVLCYALDRLSRNQAHTAILIEEMNDHRARLELVTEDFEDSAVGRFIMSAKSFAAEIEREKFAERSARGRKARVERGHLIAGPRPLYGYQWSDDRHVALVVNPTTGPVVQRIFAEMRAGRSLRSIALGLTNDKIKTPTGKARWGASTVAYILKHPSYAGQAYGWAWRPASHETTNRTFDHEQAIVLPEGVVPPLVAPETWDAVQATLQRNKQRASRNNRNPEESLLRGGIAICGYCGRSMQVHPYKNQGPAYKCGGAANTARPCRRHGMDVAKLDAIVWRLVVTLMTDPEIVRHEVERFMGDPDKFGNELRAIERTLAGITRRQHNLVQTLAEGADLGIDDMVRAELAQLRDRKVTLDHEREVLLKRQATWELKRGQLHDLDQWREGVAREIEQMPYEEKRLLLDTLQITVEIYRHDHDPRYVIRGVLGTVTSHDIVNISSRSSGRPSPGRAAAGPRP